MVQRKAPEKLNSQVESKKNHAKSERRSSSHQHQDIRNKGGSDLKKMMKMARSIKAAELESLASPLGDQYVQFNKSSSQKNSSPVRRSGGSPNYMKSTSSSDARKEQLQVSIHSPATSDKNRSPKNSRDSNHFKPSPSGSGVKPAKALTRKSSLKPVRPSMKKSSGIPLHPQINVNRATCSSTMKESVFPNFLDLNPGGTEMEGTSVLKVCPYTYCSLNGHRHAPLPPLKCFVSARRRLLKTQKSMKLKGLSSFRKRRSGKDEKEIDTGQMVLDRVPSLSGICPLVEEVSTDFFVEIYTNAREEFTAFDNMQGGDDVVHPEVVDEISLIRDGEMSSKTRIEDDGGKGIESMTDELGSEMSSDDNLDQSSDFFISEMEVQEYVECDHEVNPQDADYSTFLAQDFVEWDYESCNLDDLGICGDGSLENEVDESVSKVTDMDFEDGTAPYLSDEINCPDFPQDDDSNELSLEKQSNGITFEKASIDAIAKLLDEGCEEDDEETNVDPFSNGNFENEAKPADEDEQSEIKCMVEESNITTTTTQDEMETSDEYDRENVLEIEGKDTPSYTKENFSISFISVPNGASEDSTEVSIPKEDNAEEIDGQLDDQASESVSLEKDDIVTSNKNSDHAFLGDNIDGKNWNNKGEDANNFPTVQVSDSHWGLTTRDQDIADEDESKIEMEKAPLPADVTEIPSQPFEKENCSSDNKFNENQEKPEKEQHKEISMTDKSKSTKEDNVEINDAMLDEHLINSDADEACITASLECPEEGKATIIAATNSDPLHPDNSDNLKRANITRKKINEELEELKTFNPREPNFLPIEPDPEAEKVDLRHQMMDERKNAEEWMVDYALQQAVNKLAPARKRKVALLVEAFETVLPVPTYEAPLRHATVGLAHARPMQACS